MWPLPRKQDATEFENRLFLEAIVVSRIQPESVIPAPIVSAFALCSDDPGIRLI
jgi:hypothetical protein